MIHRQPLHTPAHTKRGRERREERRQGEGGEGREGRVGRRGEGGGRESKGKREKIRVGRGRWERGGEEEQE